MHQVDIGPGLTLTLRCEACGYATVRRYHPEDDIDNDYTEWLEWNARDVDRRHNCSGESSWPIDHGQ